MSKSILYFIDLPEGYVEIEQNTLKDASFLKKKKKKKDNRPFEFCDCSRIYIATADTELVQRQPHAVSCAMTECIL